MLDILRWAVLGAAAEAGLEARVQDADPEYIALHIHVRRTPVSEPYPVLIAAREVRGVDDAALLAIGRQRITNMQRAFAASA